MRRVMEIARENDQRLIQELQQKQNELEKAYTALQAAQADLLIKERMEHELQLAADMQRSLLPKTLPHYDGLRFAAHLQTAREVGGDFYDVADVGDSNVGVLIADVADKGVHAALFMAVSRTLFMQAMEQYETPSQVVTAVHRGILRASAEPFVTAFYGVLDRKNGRFCYVRAGHERPLLYRANGEVEELAGNGRFLGMIPDIQLDEYKIDLHAGDRLLLFSDGVPDTVNDAGEAYGNGRLRRIVAKNGRLSATDLVQALRTDLETWMKNAAPVDDITILVVEVS
jgi:serine phosphatase RsbU (regulator of sigma subunit)